MRDRLLQSRVRVWLIERTSERQQQPAATQRQQATLSVCNSATLVLVLARVWIARTHFVSSSDISEWRIYRLQSAELQPTLSSQCQTLAEVAAPTDSRPAQMST